jgi:hypothetical protein
MKLREIFEDGEGGASPATTSADIAQVSYPLFVRGKTRKEKRKNARKAVGQSYNSGPTGVGTGIYEGEVPNVIYRLDREAPMDKTEILVLGGAGRYTLEALRNKARREAGAIAEDLSADHGGSFRGAQHNIRQLANTLNTIVAAYDQLAALRKRGGATSRGIRNEDVDLIANCFTTLENYVKTVGRAAHIVEGLQIKLNEAMKNVKMDAHHSSSVKGMFHLNTDPGYGFYRYAIHVAGSAGGDKVVLGPNGGPFAYAYTDEEEEMIRDAVKAITGKDPIQMTGGESEELDFVNTKSTMPTIDWKKVK